MAETTETAPCQSAACDHHWVSHHAPGHAVYWVRVCSLCGHPDWADLDREIASATSVEAAERAVRDIIAEKFGPTIAHIADETTAARLAEIGSAVRANERERIKGLFGQWITIAMSEPNSHPPEAWIAAFADLVSDKPQFKLTADDPEAREEAEFAADAASLDTDFEDRR